MNFTFLKQLWLSVRSNPVFVAVWTAFAGAFVSELTSAIQAGAFDWTLPALEKMAATAGTVAMLALLHLYTPAPGTNPKP
jgi:hypothetical protein